MPANATILDVEHETVIPLASAHKHPMLCQGRRPGRPIARQTLERWRCRGVKGADGNRVKLETMLVGGMRVTSDEALTRFFTRLNGGNTSTPSPKQSQKQHQEAERELAALGM